MTNNNISPISQTHRAVFLLVIYLLTLGMLKAQIPTTGLVAYYPFSGNANDESGNGNDGTVNGATLAEDRFGNVNSAYSFDGVDDYIGTPVIFTQDKDPISLSAWIKTSVYDANNGEFYHESNSGQTRNQFRLLGSGNSATLTFDQYPPSGGLSASSPSLTEDHLGLWTHIVISKSVDVVSFYVNGSFINNASHAETYSGAAPNTGAIGGHPGLGSEYFIDASLDDIRIYNRALSAAEIDSLYHEGNWDPSLVAYYPFSGNANDESGNGNDGTEHSVTLAEDRFGRVDSAYSFSGGYISMPTDASILNTPIDQYTFQAWIRSTSSTGNPQNVFETHTQAPSGNREIYFEADMPAPMRFGITDVSGADHQVVSNSLELNTWYQVVGTYDGSKQKIYIDGELQDSLVWSSSFTINSGAELGKDMEGGQYFQGQLDDIRIYNRALSAAEINSLYHEKGWDPDLLVHYPFNGNANDESGNGNNGTVDGATQTTDRFGNASSAYSFDGVDDYIYTPVRPVSGALTISLWMKSNSSVAFSGLVLSHDGIKKTGLLLNNPATQLRFTLQTTTAQNAVVAADQNYLDDAWHHVVGSYDGTELVLLIDNVVRGTVALTGDVDLGDTFRIGTDEAFADRYYSGIIDDIRIYNRALSEAEVEALYHEGGWDIPPPEIVSTSPTQNALNVAQDAAISVTFDMEMNATSLNASTFVIHASQTGRITGAYSYDAGSYTATFSPGSPFKVGEQVSVTLTTGVQNAAGDSLAIPYSWTFTAEVLGGSGIYTDAVNYGAGDGGPYSVTAADLDGDGDADLAVANDLVGNVLVLLNNGAGGFSDAVNYGVGGDPQSVTAADLDGDGDCDLAVANTASDNVSVLLNDGKDGFAAAVNYGVGTIPHSVTAADLDGDGNLDLAVANWSSHNVSVLLNEGAGSFAAAVNYSVGSGPISITAADLDGDGDADLASANEFSDDVSVLLNNGSGSFAAAVNYSVGTDPSCVTAADLDGDGDLDLAVANWSSHNVSVLLNNGSGSFAAAVNYGAGLGSPYSVTTADLDGDGDRDLAVANYGHESVSVLLNDGSASFAAAANYSVGTDPSCVTAADLDGDGDLDLAVANWSSHNVSVLLNSGGAPPVAGLVAHFPFNGNANDETGNGNDGTVAGAILAADRFGRADSAYSFDGVDDVITGSLVSASGMDTAITTAAWFYQPAEAGHPGAGIVGVGATGNGQHFYQRLFADYGDSYWDGADGQNRLFIGADDGINDRWWGSDSIITTNEWHFAVTTYSSASREVRIYIDGTPDRIINLSDDLSLTNYLFIGCDGHNDNYFEGLIDDIRIYDRALVDAEIQALYQEGGWLERATADTQYVTGSTNVEFPGTDVWMNFDFTSQTGVDTVVVKAFQATPGGNLPASMSLVEPRYWEFAHSGQGVFSVWLEFDLGAGAFNADDQANPAQIKLLRRGSASVTDWTIAAEGVSASESTIFFGSITGFSQFAIGRSTDTEAPSISNVSVPVSASRGVTVSVSASVTDASALDTVILNYRRGGSTDYSRVGMNSLGADTYNGNILGTAVTESGLACFIVAEDEYGNRDSSSTTNIPVGYYGGNITTDESVSAFSYGFPFNKWRLISLPSNVNDKSVASIIQGVLEIAPSDETWELHRYVGFYEETDGLVLGESYFLKQIVTEDALHFTLGAGESVDLTGWNLLLPSRSWSFISSPYPFPVSVSADQVIFDGPYTYGEFGSGRQEGWSMGQVQTTLRPWGGYIIYNNTNQNQTLDIEPLTLSKGRLAKGDGDPPEGWLVEFTVEGERYFDGGNIIGRLAGAAEGRDHFDTPEPPFLEGFVSLAMDQPDWAEGAARFTSDIRPMDDINGIWDLDLRTRGEKGPINLTFKVVGNVPDDVQVALLDLMERQAYGLTAGEKPEAITEYNESLPYHLKVISGTADFVESTIEEVLSQLPEDFALAQNYPNPFNAVTTIEYALPKPSRVSLRVYNVLGKEIVTLLNDRQDIGYHEIIWNGVDYSGRDIASGVYFAVLQSEGVIKSIKMVLLK
ncbi:LamG-like jellyroll fold domain-containing protein [Candidatus Neomarinimicrobiota bacterium]